MGSAQDSIGSRGRSYTTESKTHKDRGIVQYFWPIQDGTEKGKVEFIQGYKRTIVMKVSKPIYVNIYGRTEYFYTVKIIMDSMGMVFGKQTVMIRTSDWAISFVLAGRYVWVNSLITRAGCQLDNDRHLIPKRRGLINPNENWLFDLGSCDSQLLQWCSVSC